MIRRLALTLLLAIAAPLAAQDAWTSADSWREAGVVALYVADWAQTRSIADHPGFLHEENSLLGPHPSRGRVDLYFAASIALNIVVARSLPRRLRGPFQAVSAAWEASFVDHNLRAGIRFTF